MILESHLNWNSFRSWVQPLSSCKRRRLERRWVNRACNWIIKLHMGSSQALCWRFGQDSCLNRGIQKTQVIPHYKTTEELQVRYFLWSDNGRLNDFDIWSVELLLVSAVRVEKGKGSSQGGKFFENMPILPSLVLWVMVVPSWRSNRSGRCRRPAINFKPLKDFYLK